MPRLYHTQRKYVMAHQFDGDIQAVEAFLADYGYRHRLITVEPMRDRLTRAPYLHIRDVLGREIRVDVGEWLVYKAHGHSELAAVGNDEFGDLFELADAACHGRFGLDYDDDANVPGDG